MPLALIEPRRVPYRHRSLIFLKALMTIGIVAGLVSSIYFTINDRIIDGTEGKTAFPIDFNRIDASGEDETTSQGEIIFDVMPNEIKLEILGYANDGPKEFHVGAQGPQILIYHTHTREAYRQTVVDAYAEIGESQTLQQSQSVVAAGEVLKAELERYGFSVIHDTTDHVPPAQNTSYSRSLETMKRYQKEYPTLRIFIDVHRDSSTDVTDFVTVNGEECARMMFVVDNGEGYDIKPDYESNYKLAQAITNELEKIHNGFTRPIRIKSHSHNQNISDMCLLIELGHNANTLEQAKNAVKYFAMTINRVVKID